MPETLGLAPESATSFGDGNPVANHVADEIARLIWRDGRSNWQARVAYRTERGRRWIDDQKSRNPVTVELLSESLRELPRLTARQILTLLAEPLGMVVSEAVAPTAGGDPYIALHRAVAAIGEAAGLLADNPGPMTAALADTFRSQIHNSRAALDAAESTIPPHPFRAAPVGGGR